MMTHCHIADVERDAGPQTPVLLALSSCGDDRRS